MSDNLVFTPLRLSDASRLRSSGNPLVQARNLADCRQALRQLLELCGNRAWLVLYSGLADPSGNEDERLESTGQEALPGRIAAILGYQMIDPTARRAVLHLYSNTDYLSAEMFQAILNKAFRSEDIFRLELAVTDEKKSWLPVLQAAGLVEEGRLRACQYDSVSKRHHDVLLYSILRPESGIISTAFVPFKLGVFAITGTEQALLATNFIHYGAEPDSVILKEAAEMLGLSSSNGEILPRAAVEPLGVERGYISHPRAPAVVRQAAEQAAAYFTGRLYRFDLPLDLSAGSDFQQKVWQTLAVIPWGVTWTYEELASRLDPANWPEARRMARAVGAACGANPLPLILPCHRVIGKDGKLVGFSGGLDIKEYLLAHELMGLND